MFLVDVKYFKIKIKTNMCFTQKRKKCTSIPTPSSLYSASQITIACILEYVKPLIIDY